MKLNNYIVASLLSHILLFSVFVVFHPEMNTEASAPVFDVDIVGPVGEEETVPKTINRGRKPGQDFPSNGVKIPVRPGLSESKKSEEKKLSHSYPEKVEIDSEPHPETMFGEGTESEPAESSEEETAVNLPTNETGSTGLSQAGETSLTDKEGVLPEGAKGLPLKPKSFLFDKETIEKYAQRGTTEGKDLTFDVPEFHHRGYMRMLKDKIENIWKYPKGAARRGISGDLYIRFSIKRDGSLGDVELIRTSGYKDLDNAAMKALEDAEPYWPLPDDWEKDEFSITGHFIYLIGRSYVM